MRIQTDYMAIDTHIASVKVYDIIPDQLIVMCDLYGDSDELVCHGACYWYKGTKKNIPFTLTTTDINQLINPINTDNDV